MPSLSKKEAREFLDTVGQISDERVLYFYMMLGSALADATSAPRLPRATPASAALREITKRMSV